MINRPILITGAARSRTSLVAGIVHLCGAFGGQLLPPNINNKKGMFENFAIREQIIKPFLRYLNADPLGQNPLPDQEQVRKLTSGQGFGIIWKCRVLDILRSQGLHKEMRWFYKDAKICLTWQAWREAFPDARWIIVRRNTDEIIDSCLRTSFMKGYKNREGWEGWVNFHIKRFCEMLFSDMNITVIWTDKLLDGDYSVIQPLVEESGLKWDKNIIDAFVSSEITMRKELV